MPAFLLNQLCYLAMQIVQFLLNKTGSVLRLCPRVNKKITLLHHFTLFVICCKSNIFAA